MKTDLYLMICFDLNLAWQFVTALLACDYAHFGLILEYFAP
jgi:hypothetical protein